jgi:hypothetical protein
VGHGVAVGAQGHRVRLEIYLSLVLREGLIHRQFIVMCSYGESRMTSPSLPYDAQHP